MAVHLRTCWQDGVFDRTQVTAYQAVNGEASRTGIKHLLLGKLSDALTDGQKYNKASNWLGKLCRRWAMENVGSDPAPRWKLALMN